MATTYKVLGQSNPAATTNTTLYTVPAATSTIVSTISVCNQAASAGTYRIAVRVAGAALATSQYLVFDASLSANSTDTITLGITLAATDVVTVYASSANFSFAAFGTELS
jgi:glucose-6-phosphate dehydrogenase assembly protein OpcA